MVALYSGKGALSQNLLYLSGKTAAPNSRESSRRADSTTARSPAEDGTFDRQQSERLIDYEKPYQYCLNISYNEEGTPGKGSAIFLHCYSDNSYTEGCIAIPEDAMKRILRRVDKDCVLLIDRRENLQTY